MRKLLLSSILIVLFITSSQAQVWESGMYIGGAAYKGDLKMRAYTMAFQTRPVGGAFARFTLNDAFAFKAQMLYGQLYGNEKKYGMNYAAKTRGYSFTSTFTDVTVTAEWHSIGIDRDWSFSNSDRMISIYGSLGLGFTSLDTKTNYNENTNPANRGVNPDADAKYPMATPVVPIGLGMRINFTDNFAVNIETGGRYMFTDYVDGVSKILGSKSKDVILMSGITFSYIFDDSAYQPFRGSRSGRRVRCPRF